MIRRFKQEWALFCEALVFYTRLPGPTWAGRDGSSIAQAAKFLPAIGLLVAGISLLVLKVASLVFPIDIALVLSMLASMAVTGAFHEDGLADSCDGFGGGHEPEQIIRIMRDSRIGTFGVIGLVGVLSLKFLSLRSLAWNDLIFGILIGHSLSRQVAYLVMQSLPYASDHGKSKVATENGDRPAFILPVVSALLPLLLSPRASIVVLTVAVVCYWLAKKYLYRRLRGYTGDCLGAVQQITEVCLLMGVLLQCKFG